MGEANAQRSALQTVPRSRHYSQLLKKMLRQVRIVLGLRKVKFKFTMGDVSLGFYQVKCG